MSDLISKAEVLSLPRVYAKNARGKIFKEFINVKDIDALPSVQHERKTGKWICSNDMYETAVCSVCGWDTTEPWDHIRHWFNFCPNCGADMRERRTDD